MSLLSKTAKAYAKNVANRSARGAEKQSIKDAALAAGKTEKQAANEANREMAKKAGKNYSIEKMDVGQSRKDSSFTKESSKTDNKTLALAARETETGKMLSMKKPSDRASSSRSVADRQGLRSRGEKMYAAGLAKEAKKDATKVGAIVGAGAAAAAATKKEEKKTSTAKGRRGGVAPSGSAAADGRTKKEDYPTYKKGTESSAAFRKAFKTAKDDGAKTFTFEGRRYTTADKK